MDALGQGYRNDGTNPFTSFLAGAAGGFLGGMLAREVHDELTTRQREADGLTWQLVHSECMAANLSAGVRPGIAEHLALTQTAYLICVEERRRLWWRLPLQAVVRGALIYCLWFPLSFLMLLFSVRDHPAVTAVISFGFSHWEFSLAVGLVWAWWALHRAAQLPFIPFTGGRLTRPWFPGDPAPAPGSTPRGPRGPGGSSGGSRPAALGPGYGPRGGTARRPSRTTGPPARSAGPHTQAEVSGTGRGHAPRPTSHGRAGTPQAAGSREPVRDYVDRIKTEAQLWCLAITMFLSNAGKADSPRARRFKAAAIDLDRRFAEADTHLTRGNHKAARRIIREGVQPILADVASWFANDAIAAPRPDLTRRDTRSPAPMRQSPEAISTPTTAEVIGRAMLFAEAMNRAVDDPPAALGPAPVVSGIPEIDQTIHTTHSIVQGFYGPDRWEPTPQQSAALVSLANSNLADEWYETDTGWPDPEDGPPAHITQSAAYIAKVEPDLRLLLTRCQRFLDARGEHDTPRARWLHDTQASVEADFQAVRAALFAHDATTAIQVLTQRIRPITDTITQHFDEEDL